MAEETVTPQPAPTVPADANGEQKIDSPSQKVTFVPNPGKSPFFGGQKTLGNVLDKARAVTTIEQASTPINPVRPPAPQPEESKPAAPSTETAKDKNGEFKTGAEKPEEKSPSETEIPEGEEKPAPMRGVDLSGLPGYQPIVGKPDDATSIQKIIKQHGGDPKNPAMVALANQLLHHQRFESQRYNDSELRRLRDEVRELKTQRTAPTNTRGRYHDEADYDDAEYDETQGDDYEDDGQEPERQAERRTAARQPEKRKVGRPKDDMLTRAEKIAARIESEELGVKEGFVEMAKMFNETLDEREQNIFRKQEQRAERARQENMVAMQDEVDSHNASIYVNRAKSILAEAARREGQPVLAQRYADPNYQLNENEYARAQERLAEEFEYIQRYFKIPDTGKVTMDLFNRAARDLNSQDYEQQIRLDERKKFMAMMSKAQPTGGNLKADSGPAASRAPVGAVNQPPSDLKTEADFQRWYLSLPREERDRVLKERGLAR